MIDDQGLVYANPAKTELIGVVPNFPGDFSGGFANIVIPASVKAITGYVDMTNTSGSQTTGTNHGAFENMASLTNVTFASNNVTRIGAQAFKGCSNLATISLPSSVSYIGTSAFEGCNKLNTINLQNVSYIGNSAFKSAFSSIPTSSVELNVEKANYVGQEAFSGTSGLKTINFNNNTVLQTVANSAFLNSGITSLDLSQATKLLTIGNSAFQGCSSLTEVKVPKSLKEFGTTTTNNRKTTSIFNNCTSLTTIDLSSTQVTSLPDNLFNGCSSLSNVKLPAGLTEIGETAFQNTTSLKTIEIPSSVTTLGGSAFSRSGLTAIDLSATKVPTIQGGTFENAVSLTDVKLPSVVTEIQTRAFAGSGLTTINLSDTALTIIANGVFANTTNLTNLTVPKTLTAINSQDGTTTGSVNATFYGSGLTALDLSQTQISAIKLSTFNGATKLETVKLPSTVTSIEQNAFKDTTALKTLTQEAPAPSETPTPPAGRATGNKLASTLTKIDNFAFQGTGLESIDLSETKITGIGSTSLGNSAFQDAVNLSNVKLPNGLIAIPAASFAGTVKLTSIEIPNTVNRINAGNSQFKGAFQGSGLTSIDLSQTKVTGVTTDNTDGA